MVRAGHGASYVDDFIEKNIVAIGWDGLGEIAPGQTRKQISEQLKQGFPAKNKHVIANNAGQIYRYLNEIKIDDFVITYDPGRRIYHIGRIKSEPRFEQGLITDLARIRDVEWLGEVARDNISTTTKNSLGAISTLFQLPEEAKQEMLSRLQGEELQQDESIDETDEEQTELLARDLRSQSREFIKDRITKLDWQEMQELVAGLLRAMGYKTRISPVGPDRGVDIIASPDGLGFESPRIVVEVKHRPNTSIGAQDVRSFLGGRHNDDKGLYVSTGGFSKDARYEADRASIPCVLLDIDDLTKEIIRHYSEMDTEAKSLVPLTNIYWPV